MLASALLARRGTGVAGHPLVDEAHKRLCSGSTPVVGAFLEHEPILKSYVSRFVPHAADIDDLVQEVFVRAYDAECKRPVYAPAAFMFRVARNLSLKEIRRRANYRSSSLTADSLGSDLAEMPDPGALALGDFQRRPAGRTSEPDRVPSGGRQITAKMPARVLAAQVRRALVPGNRRRAGNHCAHGRSHVDVGVQRCGEYLRSVGMT